MENKLPKGWEIRGVSEFAELSKEKYTPKQDENMKCLELEHFNQEIGSINGWVNSSEQKSTKNKFEKGQVLFGKLRPYLKKYWLAEFDGVCSSEVWVLNSKPKKCSNDFLFRLIQSNKFLQAANVSSGSKMPRADWSYVSEFPFPLPPLPEQQKIAALLSTWDTAIQTTQALLKKYELRKKGLMQRLFGNDKLKREKWEEVELGDILDYEQPTKYIVKNTLYNEKFKTPVLTAGKTFLLGYTDEKDGICNDLPVIIFDDFTTTSQFVDFPFKVKSSAMKLLRAKENANIKYVFEVMQMIKYKVGGHERHWISKFAYLTIPLPPIEEQNRIAKIFQTADQEISLLKSKIEKLKEQKKGLMQVLLTGKKRLIGYGI